jgi:hypothetical protein
MQAGGPEYPGVDHRLFEPRRVSARSLCTQEPLTSWHRDGCKLGVAFWISCEGLMAFIPSST